MRDIASLRWTHQILANPACLHAHNCHEREREVSVVRTTVWFKCSPTTATRVVIFALVPVSEFQPKPARVHTTYVKGVSVIRYRTMHGSLCEHEYAMLPCYCHDSYLGLPTGDPLSLASLFSSGASSRLFPKQQNLCTFFSALKPHVIGGSSPVISAKKFPLRYKCFLHQMQT